MKVRWSQHSLRLRITPTELATLVTGAPISTVFAFPGDHTWKVVVTPAAALADLRWDGRGFDLMLTDADVARLADGATEGVYFHTGGEPRIGYFIEKDFPCAHPHAEEACEEETERFAPTASYRRRKHAASAGDR